MVRQARNASSPVTGNKLDLTILTGDNADSQQYNETRWFIDMLDGTTGPGNPNPEDRSPSAHGSDRKLDPNSGIPAPGCEATPGSVYDGVRDSGRPGPDDGYYEPDSSSAPRDDGDGYSPDRARTASSQVGPGLGRPPQAVANHDGYYSFVPKPGLRFAVLDTITDECGTPVCSVGSVDDTQSSGCAARSSRPRARASP